MPLTSADIAAQIAAGQQAHMMQLQSADLISDSLRRTHDLQYGAHDLAGRAINSIGAFGIPAVGLASGLMGLDPLSLGMRGFGVGKALGLGTMGSLGIGAGAVGVGSAGAMAAAFTAQQMHLGMQQQQHFARGMQASYNFLTPQGMGFNNQQLGAIGNQLRQMSGQIGPLGQMVGFEELGALAQNMGQMGMARGVQDVTQFTQNFRKMIESVKHVAKELGTSLQEAQQMMGNMRNSGIFSNQGQMQMASEMRSLSLAGNLGIPELTQMAGIGSRVARAVGGLGSHGAFAGVRTIGQIGMAMQVGALTEEDIYNTTGLRGAEGRQALAASQVQGAAAWLRSGRGRRFLASMAGADGTLDEEMVRAWQTGDMGIAQTMGNSGRMAERGVDRANFLRNEGRLRGAALAAFGGNIPAMAMSQWAASKGLSLHDIDDRSIVFAQRQLGMSRDEVESALKILQSMPEQVRSARISAMTDQYRQDVAAHRRTSGLEGVKRKVEATREHVQNYLQGKGQQIYTDLVNDIENWIDKRLGVMVNQATKDVDVVYARVMEGRGGSRANAMFGLGFSSYGAKSGGSMGAPSAMKGLTPDQLTSGSFFGISVIDKLKESGYGSEADRWLKGDAGAQQDILGGIRGARMANDKEAMAWAKDHRSFLNALYSSGGVQDIRGADRARELAKRLKVVQQYDARTEGIIKKLSEGKLEDRMNAAASLEEAIGVSRAAGIAENSGLSGGLESLLGGSGLSMRSDHDRIKEYSLVGSMKELTDEQKRNREDALALARDPVWKKALRGATGARESDTWYSAVGKTLARIPMHFATMGLSSVAGAVYGAAYQERDAYKTYGLGSGENKFQGQFLISEEGLGLSYDVLSGRDRTSDLQVKIQSSKKDSEERSFYQRALRVNQLIQDAKKENKEVNWATQSEDVRMTQEAMVKSFYEQTDINRRQAAGRDSRMAQGQLDKLRSVGMLTETGDLTSEAQARLSKLGIAKGSSIYQLLDMGNKVLAGRAGLTADQASVDNVTAVSDQAKAAADKMDGSSYADLAKAAQARRALGDYDGAAYLQQQADQRRRIEGYTQRGGAAIGTAMALGIKLDRREANDLAGMTQGDARLSAFLAHKLGVSNSSLAGIDKELEQLKSDALGNKISGEEYEKRRAALVSGRDVAEQEARVYEKLGTGKDAVNEKGISEQERMKRLSALMNSDDYKAVQKKKEEEKQKNDPSLKHLSEISGSLKEIKSAFVSLPGEIAKASKSTATAPQPGG